MQCEFGSLSWHVKFKMFILNVDVIHTDHKWNWGGWHHVSPWVAAGWPRGRGPAAAERAVWVSLWQGWDLQETPLETICIWGLVDLFLMLAISADSSSMDSSTTCTSGQRSSVGAFEAARRTNWDKFHVHQCQAQIEIWPWPPAHHLHLTLT